MTVIIVTVAIYLDAGILLSAPQLSQTRLQSRTRVESAPQGASPQWCSFQPNSDNKIIFYSSCECTSQES